MYNYNYTVKYSTNKEYNDCILGVFGQKEYSDVIAELITSLCNPLCKEKKINNLFINAASIMLSEDVNMGMIIMFSYDYFYLFHKIIAYYNKCNTILDNECNTILAKINKK